MATIECAREHDVLAAIAAGHSPERFGPELRGHVDVCASCAEIALVAPSLREDYLAMSADVHVPAAGQVWWRAAVRARLDAAETAARPITWMQGLAGAAVVGLLAALVGMAWPPMRGYAAWAVTSLLPRASFDPRMSALVVALARQMAPLFVVVALCMLVTPIAVYLATSDE